MDEELGLGEVGALTVYRIAQEALTNVTRHAHADMPGSADRSDGRVRLRVSDDGVGPSPAPDRGAGLLGDRGTGLWLVGGRWDLSSRPGGGTILDVEHPGGSQMSDVVRVAVVDDQEMVRDGFALMIAAQPDMEVAAASRGTGSSSSTPCVPTRTSTWLWSTSGCRCSTGFRPLRALTAVPHAPAVVVVTTFDDDVYVLDAIAAGARGFLLKRCSGREWLGRCAQWRPEGRSSPARLRGRFSTGSVARARSPVSASAATGSPGREHDVLALVGAGLNNAEISERLHLSMSTVKSHVTNVLAKTGSRDRVQAAILAIRAGITPLTGSVPPSGPSDVQVEVRGTFAGRASGTRRANCTSQGPRPARGDLPPPRRL